MPIRIGWTSTGSSVTRAKERGVVVAIGPDAHSTAGLDYTEIGVGIARKGWLEPAECAQHVERGRDRRARQSEASARMSPRASAAPPKPPFITRKALPKRPKQVGREVALEYIRRLEETYPDAKCSLDFTNPYELLVATILSAQCTDVRVNMVTPDLFARFPDPAALADGETEDLENRIKSTGFFRNKTKSLLGMARAVVDKHRGEIPRTMDELTHLPGVGRKTANVILGNAFGLNEGVVVDTHVTRVAFRLGPHARDRSGEDRAGPDEDRPAREVDVVLAPADLSRPGNLCCASAAVRDVSAVGFMSVVARRSCQALTK